MTQNLFVVVKSIRGRNWEDITGLDQKIIGSDFV